MISAEVMLDGARAPSTFFVMCKYQRQGLGEFAAHTIFERTPTAWGISVLHNSS